MRLALSPDTRLGPYVIIAPLGAGGMGEVYRARDTRLDRDVAIKVMPASVASDPDRRVRFEREAKAVAALSHPNILAIFDTGVSDGVAYAVTELLAGETLRDRLKNGALPIRKAVDTAIQMARGLGAAHDKGIVHRDLKPENVFVLADGQVKILDFGLAKTVDVRRDSETVAMTDPGIVMGTVGYMAPEQIRGDAVDGRADLFALGALLYEMLSGQRAYRRDTAAETMTAILKDDPPELSESCAELPAGLDRIVRHALEKNPSERFQTARDIAFALEALSGSGTARISSGRVPLHSKRRVSIAVAASAVLLTAIVAAAAGAWWNGGNVAPVRKINVSVEKLDTEVSGPPVISPNGRRVAYTSAGKVYVRALDSLDPSEILNSAGALYPSWSPDSTALTFVKDHQLWRVNIDGGKGVALGTVPSDMGGSGGTLWQSNGRIVLSGSNSMGLTSISERGGDVTPLLGIDPTKEVDFHEIAPLPNDGIVFTIHRIKTQRADTIDVLVNGTRTTVLQLAGENLRRPVYAASGHLLYQRETINPGIWAVKFSPKTLKTEGEPFLVEPLGSWPSLSTDGTLSFVRPTAIRPDMVWVDRSNTVTTLAPLTMFTTDYGGNRFLSLSPDGKRVLITLKNASNGDLWMYDITSKVLRQVTRNAGQAVSPSWFPDGTHALISASYSARYWNLHRVSLENGAAERLSTGDYFPYSGAVSPDARTVVFADGSDNGTIWSMPLDASGHAGPPARISPQGFENLPALSPDGHWVAYAGFSTGQLELFVRKLAPDAEAHRVSTDAGTAPVWSRDGRELFYRDGDRIVAAKVAFGPAGPTFSEPATVATVPIRDGFSHTFDAAPDGRILMTRTTGRDQLALVLNWPEELRRIEKAGVGR